ncbi:MAG: hypothetical protein E5299_02046 [Burkholderia gladioli]|nr:MAG: hypothetical protein E5299_02046 [Burkholderia gladioli]
MNWAAYNAGLINRGNVTIWINEAVLAKMADAIPTRGRLRLYGDMLDSSIVWHKDRLSTDVARPARFHQSLRNRAFPSLPVQNDSTLCLREKCLMLNCRSFAKTSRSTWWSKAPV